MSLSFTGATISETYFRVVQYTAGQFYDGLGNLIPTSINGATGPQGLEGATGPQGPAGDGGLNEVLSVGNTASNNIYLYNSSGTSSNAAVTIQSDGEPYLEVDSANYGAGAWMYVASGTSPEFALYKNPPPRITLTIDPLDMSNFTDGTVISADTGANGIVINADSLAGTFEVDFAIGDWLGSSNVTNGIITTFYIAVPTSTGGYEEVIIRPNDSPVNPNIVLHLPADSGTIARLEDITGGTVSIAIPDTQIAFGNSDGDGITSSRLLTFDERNGTLLVGFPSGNKHMFLNGSRQTQVMGDVDNTYGGSKIGIVNDASSNNVYSEGVVVTNSEIIFGGGGALDDLIITGAYDQLDTPTYTINTIPFVGALITYTILTGSLTVNTGNSFTFDNGAAGNMVYCNMTDTFAIIVTTPDPSSAVSWTVTGGPDTGATGTVDIYLTGDTFVLNCSSVLDGKFGIAGGVLNPTINGITALLQNGAGHNSLENWTFDIVRTTVKGLNLDYKGNNFGIGDTLGVTNRKIKFDSSENAIGFGGFAIKPIGVELALPGTPVPTINGIMMDYTGVEDDTTPYSDIYIGNIGGILNNAKLEIYEDDVTNSLTYYNGIGNRWLDATITLGEGEDNARYFAFGDINRSYACTRLYIDDAGKEAIIGGLVTTYPSRTTFAGIGTDDITIDGDYTGYLATDKFKVTILDTDVQLVRLLSGSAPGEINIGDDITCSPGDPGPSDATGKIIAFQGDPLAGTVYVKVTSPDIFAAGSIFTNIITGFFSTIDSVSVLSDYVTYQSSDTTEDYLLEPGHYIAKGIESTAQSIVGHTIGDVWSFTINTQNGNCLDLNYTTSKHRLGTGHNAQIEVNTRSKSINILGGISFEGKTIGGDTQVRENDRFFDVKTSSAVNITLPLIANLEYDHQLYTFTDWEGNAAANNITILCQLGNTIKGTNNIRINAAYGSVTLKSNKTTQSWMVISKTF